MNSTNNEMIKEQSSEDVIHNDSIKEELKFAYEPMKELPYKDLINTECSESVKKGWVKSDVKPEPKPRPRPDDEPERAVRKKRATNEIIRNFVKWCFENNAFDKYTNGRIRQMYLNETSIELTTSTINNQRKRWVVIDGKIYDRNKTYLMPKNK